MPNQQTPQFLSIKACLESEYGLTMVALKPLDLGADYGTSVFRVETKNADGARPYFLKLRRGPFDDVTVQVPHLLAQGGLSQIIGPIRTISGALYTHLENAAVMLYPFIAGQSGFAASLSHRQWRIFGQAVCQMHTARLPASIIERLPRETYADEGRRRVQQALKDEIFCAYDDPSAAGLAALLTEKRATIHELVLRADHLAGLMQTRDLPFVLCHADLHAGNVLIAEDAFYIVDWDTLMMAPKEHDLMFIGARIGGIDSAWAHEAEAEPFFSGYGETEIDAVALAYYRCERIVQDIAVTCDYLFGSTGGEKDRVLSLQQMRGQFAPGDVIDVAWQTYARLPSGVQVGVGHG